MPRISRRYLNQDIETHLCDILWEYFARLRSHDSVKESIDSLLSETEKIMIAKRLAIAVLLSRGYTFDIIDDKLKVSKATIAGVHHQITSGASGYRKAVEEVERMCKLEASNDSIEEFLLKLIPPSAVGSSRYMIKSSIGKELYKHRKRREVL
jgi:uncharacterized protein YerC